MNINEKIKTINNKIKPNKTQYDLVRLAAKISALSSGYVSKYYFLPEKDVLPGKGIPRKSCSNQKILIFFKE